MSERDRSALIVGASRGLGLGLVKEYLNRGWRVVATSRGSNDAALHQLAGSSDGRLTVERLDVTDMAGIEHLARKLAGTTIDLLFVSAGVARGPDDRAGDASAEEFMRLMLTNTLAPLKIIEAIGDAVAPRGAIVAMTSILGSVAGNTSGGWDIYRASKAALNTLLRSYAARHAARTVIAMHPGWVRTDMGGSNAAVGIEESATGIADVIEGCLGKPGCVYVDYQGKTLPW